jgi:hypothetical protein
MNTNISGINDPVATENLDQVNEIGCSIPAELFNNCRNSLTDISYMFANCTNLRGCIGTGYAKINAPEKMLSNYKEIYLNKIVEDMVAEYEYALSQNSEYNSDNNEITDDRKAEIEEITETEIKTKYGVQDLHSLSLISGWYNLEELFEFVNDEKYTSTAIDTLDTYKRRDTNKHVEVIKKGLLSDCKQLQNVEGLFYGCINLTGPIPADMFYGNETLTNVRSLYRLFGHCYKLTSKGYSDYRTNPSEEHIFVNNGVI